MGFLGGLVDMWSSGQVCGLKTDVAHLRTCGSVNVRDMWTCGHRLVDVVMCTGDQESNVAMALYRQMDHPVVSSLVGCGQRWPSTATYIDDGHSINLHICRGGSLGIFPMFVQAYKYSVI